MAKDSSAPIDPDDVIKKSFTTVRRGLDPLEVQRYLLDLANQLRAGRERERGLEGQLADAEARATPIDELDPSRLTALLGEETARVLDAARAAASEIRAKAEENVARLLREARDEAQRMRSEAESILTERTEEAEAEVARIRASADGVREQAELDAEGIRSAAAALRDEAQAEVDALREEAASEVATLRDDAATEVAERRQAAAAEAAELTEAGRQEGREMVAEAQRVRQRMLDDLARRRRLLRQQIEQLQAGRDRLLSAYEVVRETLDVATEELHVALPEAKLAAEAASLQATEDDEAAFAAEIDAVAGGGRPATDGPSDAGDQAEDAVEPADEAPESDAEGGEPGEAVSEAEPLDIASEEPQGGEEDGPAAEQAETGASDGEPAAEGTDAEPGVAGEADASTDEPTAAHASDTTQPLEVAARRAPDPAAGRHSSSVTVVRTESAVRTAAILARVRDDEDDARPAKAVAADRSAGTAGADDEPVDAVDVGVDEAPAHPLLAARDDAIADLERNLSRRLKRDLSDEQNELLDAIRRVKGAPSAEGVLDTPDAQVQRYRSLALPLLADAAEAGAELVAGDDLSEVTTDVEELATDLAMELALPLRERLERCFAEAEGDPDELAERIRACFREWKTQRIDGVATTSVVAAANRGLVDRLAQGTPVRWVVDDGGVPSPDCDDNGLAEGVVAREAFPTGHVVPPVHRACRCIVVPVDA